MMRTGLEVIASQPAHLRAQMLAWGRCGLLCNQASVTAQFEPAWVLMRRLLGQRLTAFFGPQHGFYGTVQDNMIETGHSTFDDTGIPLFSLYSETREPTVEMLSGLDTIVIDLQIVGCRIYTWKSTIAGCLRAAKRDGKRVVVLDRPNPVGGEVLEGRVLEPDAASFVGQFAIPMRHGLSAGEAACFFNLEIGANLEVIACDGWDPRSYWHELNRPWVVTSPNLPTIDSVYVYPGTVIFEGTNISEGRGTALPFQFIGAPYIPRAEDYVDLVHSLLKPVGGATGVYLRPAQFQPTYQKWAGKSCNGLQIHVVDPSKIRSYNLSLALCRAAIEMGKDQFQWKDPPYEYDFQTLPMKLIMGSRKADDMLKRQNFALDDSYWHGGLEAYAKRVKQVLLYPREMTWL